MGTNSETTESIARNLVKKTEVRVTYTITLPSGAELILNNLQESDAKWLESVFIERNKK